MEDQIALARLALPEGKKNDFLFTVDCAKKFVKKIAGDCGYSNDDENILAGYQLMEFYEMFIAYIEEGKALPLQKKNELAAYIEHERDKAFRPEDHVDVDMLIKDLKKYREDVRIWAESQALKKEKKAKDDRLKGLLGIK